VIQHHDTVPDVSKVTKRIHVDPIAYIHRTTTANMLTMFVNEMAKLN